MLDLWSGLFAALIGGVIGVAGSVVGALITGRFMRSQQKAEFRQRANEAVRALLVELEENHSFVLNMQQRTQVDRLECSLPARLKRLVWATQLPLIAGSLDDAALSAVIQAYRRTDSFGGLIRRPDDTYAIDAHLNNQIIEMRELFDQAITAIRRATNLPAQPRS